MLLSVVCAKHALPSTDPRVLIQNVHLFPAQAAESHASGGQGHRMAGQHNDAAVSREEFRDCCLAYLDGRGRDHGLGAGWTWQAGLLPGTGYLHRRWELLWRNGEGTGLPTGQCASQTDPEAESQGICLDVTGDWGVGEEHGAPAAAGVASGGNAAPLTVEQSVCWSPIWHVPVLYFTVVYQSMSYAVQHGSPQMGHHCHSRLCMRRPYSTARRSTRKVHVAECRPWSPVSTLGRAPRAGRCTPARRKRRSRSS